MTAARPTRIRQPGPEASERLVAVPARGGRFDLVLPAGRPLLEAIVEGFAAAGFSSGTVRLDGLALGPFAYCMPAPAVDDRHAAFYSDTLRPPGITRVRSGAMTFGRRDEAPFFHAHGLWVEADGRTSGGHVLAEGSRVAETVTLSAFGLDGALFRVDPDPETGFSLFGPVIDRERATTAPERAHAIRLRPNRDFAGALEAYCRDAGIDRARIEGGVGSTVGAAFENGAEVANFATEVYLRSGRVVTAATGDRVAALDVGLVDFTGATAEGRLRRGQNPVLMTFELVLVEETEP